MKLFQYAILLHPTEDEKKAGKTTQLLISVETVLAPDQNAAIMQAGRKIPADMLDRLDRLEVAIRPF